MAAPNQYKEIAVLEGEFFPYVLGRFENLSAYSIGVMDLDDDSARMGEVSDIVFHFLITDNEYSWYETDKEKLDDLAQTLQIRMPKSRFLCARSRSQRPAEELKAACDHALGDEFLDNDKEFEQWRNARKKKAEENKQKMQELKEKEAARIAAMPKTPFNEARNRLAEHQKEIRILDQQLNQVAQAETNRLKQQEPNITPQALKEQIEANPVYSNLMGRRKALTPMGKKLEEDLGVRIFTASEIFVAIETCWVKKYPFIDPSRATISIFSTQEIADRFVKTLRDSNRYYLEVRRIERNDIKNALRTWESLGVATLLVDDGEMPCRILIKNIIPVLEKGYIERHNAGIRNLLIRNLQMGLTMKQHGDEMDEKWKKTQLEISQKLNYHMFLELSKTVFYCPVQISDKQAPQFKGNIVYTPDANKKLLELMKAENQVNPPMNRAGFTGKHIVVNFNDAMLPIRIVTAPDKRNWLSVFTSREEAVENCKNFPDTQILALSFDDLLNQLDKIQEFLTKQGDDKTIAGITLDPHSFFSPLDRPQMAMAKRLRESVAAQAAPKV